MLTQRAIEGILWHYATNVWCKSDARGKTPRQIIEHAFVYAKESYEEYLGRDVSNQEAWRVFQVFYNDKYADRPAIFNTDINLRIV